MQLISLRSNYQAAIKRKFADSEIEDWEVPPPPQDPQDYPAKEEEEKEPPEEPVEMPEVAQIIAPLLR